MTIEIDESIRAIVYHKFAKKADFMAAIMEPEPGKFTGRGRVRFYREDTGDPFLDRDKKSWYDMKEKPSLEDALAVITRTLNELAEFSKLTGFGSDEEAVTLIRGEKTLQEFMDWFTDQPFAHKKVLS